MPKTKPKRRTSAKKQAAFSRGCCLSGCLCYLGCSSVVLIALSLLGFKLIAEFVKHSVPSIAHGIATVTALLAINSFPILGVAVGMVELLQIRAVWQGYRWGIYGLIGIVLSQFGLAFLGTQSTGEFLGGVLSTAYNNFPLIILFLLIRPKWKEMR